MAAKKSNIFPAFSYPFYPEGTHQQSFVDYGSMSCYDMHINENDMLVDTTSKHSHRTNSNKRKFVAAHPTMPLLRPSSTVFSSRNFPRVKFKGLTSIKTDYQLPIIDQISDFYINNQEDTFPVGLDIVTSECGCKPWSLGWLPKEPMRNKYLQDNPRYDQERFARLFVSLPLRKSAGLIHGNEVKTKIPNGLKEALLDIPPQVVFDLMNESVEQQKHEILHFDIYQGNTLRYCELPSNQASNGVLFYPSGSNLDILNMNSVTLKHDNNYNGEYIKKPVLGDPCHTMPVNSAIRQIESVSNEESGILVAIRTQYKCSFLHWSNDSHKRLKVLETFESEDEVIDVSLSPYIHGEANIITTQGDIHIWSHGKKTDTLNVPSPAPDEKWPWYQSIWGGHPRCTIVANPVEVDLFDIRGNQLSSCFFSVKSKQVDLHERISALQRHPDNTHHYFIATDQSLLIMDDRYLQHPVFKWHHHLQDPVQFINIMCNAVPNCNDTVVQISGSVHHESHFYQYSSDQSISSSPLIDGNVVIPPVSTSLPWKMLSYDKWPSLLSYPNLPLSQVLEDRLSKSLIGVTCLPDNGTGFCVLQMSELGDMFYQPFIAKETQEPHTPGSEPHGASHLSKDGEEFCVEWIKDLISQEQKHDVEQDLKLNVVETDFSGEFEAMIDLMIPHESCALCNDNKLLLSDASTEYSVCQRCGIEVTLGRQLIKSSKKNDVITSQMFTLHEPVLDLNIFPEEGRFQNSLSQGFRQNWMSEEPTPIEHRIEKETSENNNELYNGIEVSYDNVQSGLEQEVPLDDVQPTASTLEAKDFTPSKMINTTPLKVADKTPEKIENTSPVKMTNNTPIKVTNHTPEKIENTTPVKSQDSTATGSASIPHDNSIATTPPAQSGDTMATTYSNQVNKSAVKSKKKKTGLSMGF